MRSSDERIAKYTAKLDSGVIANRFGALKDSMIEQVTAAFASLSADETATKAILTAAGVPVIQIASYLSYSRKLHGLKNKHSGAILANEAQLVKNLWSAESRGLSGAVCIDIASGVYGIALT